MKERPLYQTIWKELSAEKSMIFLSGPRQVGKTTLSLIISRPYTNTLYFNWDIVDDRIRLIDNPYFFEEIERKDPSTPLIIFDEIHKYKDWKNYLKGVYDKYYTDFKFLVSGSGRLDLYQKGGDSLAGRYFQFRLWPFTIAELAGRNLSFNDFIRKPLTVTSNDTGAIRKTWDELAELSGFPEPYLSGRKRTYRRWSNTYASQIIREDIRDLAGIKSISNVETLYHLLPSKVGSPTSITSLSSDLKSPYNTINRWLSIFEIHYLTFSIKPWHRRITRAVQKERKTYLFDAPRIKNKAARFENMIALELIRAVNNWTDRGIGTFSLHYIKNKEQQEVDFLIVDDNEPFILIETKLSDRQPSKALRKFQDQLNIPAVQLVSEGDTYRVISNRGNKILVAPAIMWLSQLP